MKNKILVVLTNQSTFGDDPEKTGLWLSEATEFIDVVKAHGYDVDYVSPKGGEVPIDPRSLEAPNINESAKEMMESKDFSERALTHSLKPSDVNPEDYVAIYYTGGHGVMWDFPDDKQLQAIAMKIYDEGNFVTSVCHGVVGLLNIKDDSGNYLIDGKKITGFTNAEEKLSGKSKKVPFKAEDEVIKRGADFENKMPFTNFAIRDGQLITGQNPMSGGSVAEELVNALNSRHK